MKYARARSCVGGGGVVSSGQVGSKTIASSSLVLQDSSFTAGVGYTTRTRCFLPMKSIERKVGYRSCVLCTSE